MAITRLAARKWQELAVTILEMQGGGCYYQKILKKTDASNSEVFHVLKLLRENDLIEIMPERKRIKGIFLTRKGYALAIPLKVADEAVRYGKIPEWLEPVIDDAVKFSKWGVKNEQ